MGARTLAPIPAAATVDALESVARRPLWLAFRVERETRELCAVE